MKFDSEKTKIAIFVSFSGAGGVERMIVNLCQGLVSEGISVDLVLVKAKSAHLDHLPASVKVIKLKASHTLTSVFEFASYLRRERPQAVLAAKDRAGKAAVFARFLARTPTRIILRLGTTLSAALEGKSPLRKLMWYLPMRLIYPHTNGIVAVSQGVADDVKKITGLPREHFRVIPNPVISCRLPELASEKMEHPWFAGGGLPILLGVGRLTRQKDFPTLIRAFAKVREKMDCRLVILGDGSGRNSLETLASELGVKEDVDFPGFMLNPYRFLSRASVFVLSSAWEGSPNVLTEALALGIPVVATDCPSGPREILAGGHYGPLVRVGDADGLAEAICETLTNPPSNELLKEAARDYTVENSSSQYLDFLLGDRKSEDKAC